MGVEACYWQNPKALIVRGLIVVRAGSLSKVLVPGVWDGGGDDPTNYSPSGL